MKGLSVFEPFVLNLDSENTEQAFARFDRKGSLIFIKTQISQIYTDHILKKILSIPTINNIISFF
jgi:hypothetical protein